MSEDHGQQLRKKGQREKKENKKCSHIPPGEHQERDFAGERLLEFCTKVQLFFSYTLYHN